MKNFRVSSHTDFIGDGSTYVAIKGTHDDGVTFIPAAIEKGATTLVLDRSVSLMPDILTLCKQKNITIKYVDNTRSALAQLSAAAYDYPAKKLKIIGVTGTDGKSTSVYLLRSVLRQAGKKVAMISGVQNFIEDEELSPPLTTPKPDYLHHFFHVCVKRGIEYVVMELSAQGFTLHRIDGIQFDGLIFTNLCMEHGEWYKTIKEYFATKCSILKQLKKDFPLIVHGDNEWGRKVAKIFKAFTSGFALKSHFQICMLQENVNHQLLQIKVKGVWHFVQSSLTGKYNGYNIAAVVGLASFLNIPVEEIILGIEAFKGVPGRLERYTLTNGGLAVIDYAHTPQAYEALLALLRVQARQLYVIFGAGGGKDHEKRSRMGQIASQYADIIVLTTDNPGQEKIEDINSMIKSGIKLSYRSKVIEEQDRAKAIEFVCGHLQAGDIVAILGKGAEESQLIGTERFHHSDRENVKLFIKRVN